MSNTNPNIISAILLELHVGVLSTSTAIDSILWSWHTILSPEHRTQMSGRVPAGWDEVPAGVLKALVKHTLGQGELLKHQHAFISSFTYLNPSCQIILSTSQNLGLCCKSKLLLNSKIETYDLFKNIVAYLFLKKLWPCHEVSGILASWPGIKPLEPASICPRIGKHQHPNNWTAKTVPRSIWPQGSREL